MMQSQITNQKSKIIITSGGQTGVDRAALDAALELGFPCGGWCPAGRRSEDGPIADRYPLKETRSDNYDKRTAWNVRDGDATLILVQGAVRAGGGTDYTLRIAGRLKKPCLLVNLESQFDLRPVAAAWMLGRNVAVLNIAGPRESQSPGIHKKAKAWIEDLLCHQAECTCTNTRPVDIRAVTGDGSEGR